MYRRAPWVPWRVHKHVRWSSILHELAFSPKAKMWFNNNPVVFLSSLVVILLLRSSWQIVIRDDTVAGPIWHVLQPELRPSGKGEALSAYDAVAFGSGTASSHLPGSRRAWQRHCPALSTAMQCGEPVCFGCCMLFPCHIMSS